MKNVCTHVKIVKFRVYVIFVAVFIQFKRFENFRSQFELDIA